MTTYTVDPILLRVMAELDENHFATFYDYDEEGQLTRIRKETEDGVFTVREIRSSKPKAQR
jgi:YD repeat-containing protein